MQNKKPTLAAIAAVLATTITMWLGGYDFDHRGFEAVFWFLMSLFLGAMMYIAAKEYWEEDND